MNEIYLPVLRYSLFFLYLLSFIFYIDKYNVQRTAPIARLHTAAMSGNDANSAKTPLLNQSKEREQLHSSLRAEARRSVVSVTSDDSNSMRQQPVVQSEDVIDAMGLIHEAEHTLPQQGDSTNFTDLRRFSEIQPDQKLIRPVHRPRERDNRFNHDVFLHQSKSLSHNKDRQGARYTDLEYGTMYNPISPTNEYIVPPASAPGASFAGTKLHHRPIPFPAYMSNNRQTQQKSLLSQSAPMSTLSEPYSNASPSPSQSENNSIYASSNPSSRRNSDVSSLDDVCFPVDSLDEVSRAKKWPNLAILEEFKKEELEDLKKNSSSAASQFSSENVNFQYPIVSNIDYEEENEPLIVSTNEEIDPINGRLRPKKVDPWKKPEYITHHDKLTKFRFTYFREDMPNTIHSPTISGLLHGGKKFEDLFSPAYYSAGDESTQSQSQTQAQAAQASQQSSQQHSHVNSPQVLSAQLNEEREASINGHKAIPSVSGANTINQDSSLNASTMTSSKFVQPFWLDVLNPSEDEMKAISKTFGIHPLTSEDIFLGEAREKVELFRDYYFVCFTSFDVEEEHQKRKKAAERAFMESVEEGQKSKNDRSLIQKLTQIFRRRSNSTSSHSSRHSINSNNSRKSKKSSGDMKKSTSSLSSKKQKKKKYNKDELIPLSMYIVVFRDGVITFHFQPTPHTGNVRRRARLLREYLTISSDWIGYALIDDITDAYAPLIEAIESEVNKIEDEIIMMQSGDLSDSDSDDDTDDDDDDPVWFKVKRRNSNVMGDKNSIYSVASSASTSSSVNTKVVSWKKKGDMLRRIGDCRRRVMSMLRLLGSKADVIKGFSKRYNEQWELQPRSEIGLYLGDIQDHIVTMVQNLNHYEKLLARSHSNYLAQINIDMTRVNNDMNDILGKITILGTIILPLNIVTGLWGMNCMVPGQDVDDLSWFWMIVISMFIFSVTCYFYVKKFMNMV